MGVLENLAKNPAVLGIAALGIVAFIFRDKISDFLSNITGGAATANILGENLLSNLQGTQDLLNNITKFFTEFEFPKFEFPEFPTFDFGSLFGGNGGGNGLDLPPDVEDTGLLTNEQRAACQCGTNIIQDIQGDVSETCISPCDIPEEGDPDFIGPVQPDEPFMLPEPEPIPEPEPPFVEPEPPFEPPVELPPGFEGFGPSFEGGTIFETDICNKSIGQIAIENGISASAAVDMKAQACEDLSFFDFGTSTGSGFGPGDDPTGGIVTGGATLESEEKKAACVSCELFGLNCPICAGTL